MKLLTVVGARPQFIKAAAVSRAVPRVNQGLAATRPIQELLVHTGQHYDDGLSAVFFRELGIPGPAYHLGVGSGPHGQQTGRMLEQLESVMRRDGPDWVLVYGDTNSTLAGALAAVKLGIPVAHVEAGLRSHRRTMAEEINRIVTDHVSTLLFCPTEHAIKNLSCEGITRGVHLVGDVMYDSLQYHLRKTDQAATSLSSLGLRPRQYILATVHRAETTDAPSTLRRLFQAFGELGMPVIVPLHPRTRKALQDAGLTALPRPVHLIEPVSYLEMLSLARHAGLIMTDSGGLQKEAYWLQVPCVTLREETEWIETVEAGWNWLSGTDPQRIMESVRRALSHPPTPSNAAGDGHTAERILDILWRADPARAC